MSPNVVQVASATASVRPASLPAQLQTQPTSKTTSSASPLSTGSSPPTVQAIDLRHVTSNHSAAPPMKERTVSASTDRSGRLGHLQTLSSASAQQHRIGSRSPTSIPSSPTSVHSSSSAIFERDIEPPPHILTHAHPTHPHRTPRSKTTEPIDSSVPSVLDSAAALLTSTDELEEQTVAVEAPASSCAASTLGSPVSRGSRSPSPSASAGAGRGGRTSMLLNLPSPVQSTIVSVPLSPSSMSSGAGRGGASPPHISSHSSSPRMSPPPISTSFSGGQTMPGGFSPSSEKEASPTSTPQQLRNGTSTPSSIGGSTHYESAPSSPKTTTLEHPPHSLPTSPSTPTATMSFASSPSADIAFPRARPQVSHPPSPSQNAHKRLSFLSYNDILNSTPISTLPLSSLTSPATDQPPPHIPGVSLSVGAVTSVSPLGSAYGGGGSRSVSLANSARNSLVLDGLFGPGHVHSGAAIDVKEPTAGGVGDDLGGEWEREGLGRGLEERLDALTPVGSGKA
ncbi:hypothetical protein ACEPAG_8922 [Sanghuangporus baumii]